MKKLQLGADVSYILSKLGNISIFHYLTENEKRQLLNISDLLEYQPGEKIISKGEISTCFYAVLSGTLNVTVKNEETSQDIFLAVIGEGEFFGESGIFSDGKRTADVTPINVTEVISFDRNSFFSFIRMFPSAGVKILMVFVNGLLKKLNDSNKELAYERRNVLEQNAIDEFLNKY